MGDIDFVSFFLFFDIVLLSLKVYFETMILHAKNFIIVRQQESFPSYSFRQKCFAFLKFAMTATNNLFLKSYH